MYEMTATDLHKLKNSFRDDMERKGIKMKDLSEMTGYSIRSLYQFFSNGTSRFIAAAIEEKLQAYKTCKTCIHRITCLEYDRNYPCMNYKEKKDGN